MFPQNELREVREELKEKMEEIKQVTGEGEHAAPRKSTVPSSAERRE